MNFHLVTIIGPPAVGKMTVGCDLSEKLGFPFLHNHLTFDVALALHPYGSSAFFSLCDRLRLESLKSAVEAGIEGLILSFCAADEGDIAFLETCYRLVENAGGSAQCISLQAGHEVLLSRAISPSRMGTSKLHDPVRLRSVLAENDFAIVPSNVPVIRVVTDGMEVREVVEEIRASLISVSGTRMRS